MASPTGASDRSIGFLPLWPAATRCPGTGSMALIVLGLLLVLPSVMAVSAMRTGVSWRVVAAAIRGSGSHRAKSMTMA